MDTKELTDALEELKTTKQEHMIILEASGNRKGKAAVPAPSADKDALPASSVQLMKKIIGDFHISPASKTYKELYTENEELRKSVSALQGSCTESQKELLEARKQAAVKENELMMLRTQKPAASGKEKGKKKKRKHHSLFRRIFCPVKKKLSEQEKKDALLAVLVRSRDFTDTQFCYLSDVLKKSALPADALARLFDARLTVPRMRQVYSLLCSRYQVSEEIGAGLEAGRDTDAGSAVPSGSGNTAAIPDVPDGKESSSASDTENSDGAPVKQKAPVLLDMENTKGAETSGTSMERLQIFHNLYNTAVNKRR